MQQSVPELAWTVSDYAAAYRSGSLTPADVVRWVTSFPQPDPAWIAVASHAELAHQLAELAGLVRRVGSPAALPLYGVPFAVKDNIDVARFQTTAACAPFARVAQEDAFVVARLRAQGALCVGKTNLDQFATGLVGTRSPYGVVPSAFDSAYIGGGSSSGSASVVSRGLVPFALGTDTAGSGRVPAALQNVVGYKPTRGRLSTRGVVPACRTLDCVSVFALTVDDALGVGELLTHYDEGDPYSRRPLAPSRLPDRPRVGIPMPLEFFGDRLASEAFDAALVAVEPLARAIVPIDFSPFTALARLLYESPWVVERLLVAEGVLESAPEALDGAVRSILESARAREAREAFSAEYRRAELARAIDRGFDEVDLLLVPTTPTTYRLSEVAADPLGTNARLGTYTNFTNLADLCGIALPAGFRADGLPHGITLLGRAHQDTGVGAFARAIARTLGLPLGATGRLVSAPTALPKQSAPEAEESRFLLAVVGAHLSGMALNHQLTERGASLVERARTSAAYRLYALPGTSPEKPALRRTSDGVPIEVEVWALPRAEVASFLELIPSPLGIGRLELADGRWVAGFICEPQGLEGAKDISVYGGFRAYLGRPGAT